MVLKEYWPRCLQELIEFQQIANAEQPEFEKVVSDVKSAANDFFLVSLSEWVRTLGKDSGAFCGAWGHITGPPRPNPD